MNILKSGGSPAAGAGRIALVKKLSTKAAESDSKAVVFPVFCRFAEYLIRIAHDTARGVDRFANVFKKPGTCKIEGVHPQVW